jgi:hypothetical protein
LLLEEIDTEGDVGGGMLVRGWVGDNDVEPMFALP